MSHGVIPQPILAEFAAAYTLLMRCRKPDVGAAVLLRLSVDRAGVVRLEPAGGIEGLTFTSMLEAGRNRLTDSG